MDGAFPPAGRQAGDLVLSPGALEAPGLAVGAGGAARIAGALSADDVLLRDPGGDAAGAPAFASLSNEVFLALYDRASDGGLGDRNFAGAGSISRAAFGGVLPLAMGGTGTASPASGVAAGALAPLVRSAGGAAPALAAAAGVRSAPSGLLSAASEIRLVRAETLGGGYHALSNSEGALVARDSSEPGACNALHPYSTGTAPSAEARPRLGPVAFERLSFRRARYSAAALAGSLAPPRDVLFAEYSAGAGEDPSLARRPRGPREAATGLSPLPYGSAPSAPDPGFDGVRAGLTVAGAAGGAPHVVQEDAPAKRHRAVRAVARDLLGNLSEVSALAWDTAPPAASTLTLPATSGLDVSYGVRVAAGPGGLVARHGLFATGYATADVPGFTDRVGSMPLAGGLSRANAVSASGPEMAWALWETLSNSEGALRAAPAVHVPPDASSNLAFSSGSNLSYDSASRQWTSAGNAYSRTYMPFVLLGDAHSNLSLHLFEDPGVVTIADPNVGVTFPQHQTINADNSVDVPFQYVLSDTLRRVTATVFPVAAPGATGAVPTTVYELEKTPGAHSQTVTGLRHTTFHRLVVELTDLQGGVISNAFDFKTADAGAPTVQLTATSADAEGRLNVAWRAADSNDGGISAVVAFSGSNPPAAGEGALRDRLASAEPRYAFDSAAAAPRNLGNGLFHPPVAAEGSAAFSNLADSPHLSHYVQVVASDTAADFGRAGAAPPLPRLAAADFGAEVPRVYRATPSNAGAPALLGLGVPNGVTLKSLAFDADTPEASVFLVALTRRAAYELFGAGGAGGAASPAAASNLWAAVKPRVGADGRPESFAIAKGQV